MSYKKKKNQNIVNVGIEVCIYLKVRSVCIHLKGIHLMGRPIRCVVKDIKGKKIIYKAIKRQQKNLYRVIQRSVHKYFS